MGKAKAKKSSCLVVAKADKTRRLLHQAVAELEKMKRDLSVVRDLTTTIYRTTDRAVADLPEDLKKYTAPTRMHKAASEPAGLPDSSATFIATPGCILQSRQ